MYCQYVANILRGHWRCNSKEQALTLGAIQLLYERDIDSKDLEVTFEEVIDQYLPRPMFFMHKASEWVSLLKEEAKRHKKLTKAQLQNLYMTSIKSTFLFGSSVFQVQHKSPSWKDLPASNITLAINEKGVHFAKQDSNQILRSFLFDQITDVVLIPRDAPTSFKLSFDRRSISGPKDIEIQSIQTIEIAYLLNLYMQEYIREGAKFARAIKDNNTSSEAPKSDQVDVRMLLQFKKDDIIIIENNLDQQWFFGRIDDRKGVVSKSSVQLLKVDPRTLFQGEGVLSPSQDRKGTISEDSPRLEKVFFLFEGFVFGHFFQLLF